MSTVETTSRLLDRLSDWANPILVKETRQALKSRQFVTTFMLLLAAAWLVSALGLLLAGDAVEFGAVGRWFFQVYYTVLAVAVLIIVPFGAYRSLLNERDENTFELLSITSLTPRQIVWGKLLSALLQALIFYSALAPFMAFTSLLQGFDLAQSAFLLVVTLLVSLGYSMIALMLSTLARKKHLQSLISLGLLAGVVLGFVSTLGFSFSLNLTFRDPDFWWGLGAAALAGISYFVLFQQITVARLTFESDNRSTGIRVTCAVQFWLLWAVIIGYFWWNGPPSSLNELQTFGLLSAVHWAVVGLFAATEPDGLSRRVRRRLPRSRFRRLLLVPWLPGGARGYLYLLMHLAALWLIVVGYALWLEAGGSFDAVLQRGFSLSGHGGVPQMGVLQMIGAVCCYIVIYIGIGAALGRQGRSISSDLRPAHVRIVTVLLVAAGQIVPLIPRVLELIPWRSHSVIDLISVALTISQLDRGMADTGFTLGALSAAAIVMVLFNVRAIQHEMRDIVSTDETPAPPPAAVTGETTASTAWTGGAPSRVNSSSTGRL